jgi:hypothetical protein
MGASYQSRLAADRERRRLRIVDPELAAILDQEELEHARRQARSIRKGKGLPQIDPEPKKKPPTNGELLAGLFWLWVAVCVIYFIVIASS